MKIHRSFVGASDGIVAVEFAILAPVMIIALAGMIELGHTMFARVVLEGATVEAARIATASIDTSQAARSLAISNSISSAMTNFPLAQNQNLTITTVVYANFSDAYPETYTDSNKSGAYELGETFVDRNKNGRWDPATPKTGTTGQAGDVLAITVRYPKRILIDFPGSNWIMGGTRILTATTVVRNEAVSKS